VPAEPSLPLLLLLAADHADIPADELGRRRGDYDIRAGSMKRGGSASGEGGSVVPLVRGPIGPGH
jgi:hypothetical protein